MQTETISNSLLKDPDVVLVGGGIMSATLGIMLKALDPALTIQIIETLPEVAQESSHPWNNAGTGHAALCELNYTPEKADGSIDISKAVRVTQQFETSKHFWAYLVEQGIIADPGTFIRACPHMSFVRGAENQDYLRKRYEAMVQSPFFSGMQFTTDYATIESWAPLLTRGRAPDEQLAATRVEAGTEVNFGALTRQMIAYLVTLQGVKLALNTTVKDISRLGNGRWQLKLAAQKTSKTISTAFVFLGAGGGALPLLQKSGIPEGRGYSGFPVSGEFMICEDPEIIAQHNAKVYGKAATGAPPMSVPHLDTRYIDGEKHLVFGPYAGFSPKFLKAGSYLDLFKSIKFDNLLPTLAAGYHNLSLTVYLLKEIFKTHKGRCEMLREFFPEACNKNWRLYIAGQRVQIIKKDPKTIGTLQFGTEVVASADGSLAAMLGASPGASTSPVIMLEVLDKCFQGRMASPEWAQKLGEMVPAYKVDLSKDPDRYHQLATRAKTLLQL